MGLAYLEYAIPLFATKADYPGYRNHLLVWFRLRPILESISVRSGSHACSNPVRPEHPKVDRLNCRFQVAELPLSHRSHFSGSQAYASKSVHPTVRVNGISVKSVLAAQVTEK